MDDGPALEQGITHDATPSERILLPQKKNISLENRHHHLIATI